MKEPFLVEGPLEVGAVLKGLLGLLLHLLLSRPSLYLDSIDLIIELLPPIMEIKDSLAQDGEVINELQK